MKLKTEKTILLADDSDFFRRKFSDVFKHTGYNIMLTADGREVIEKLKSLASEIDLLILDIQMPYIDGFGVLNWMREHNLEGKLPVLAITGAYEPQEVLTKLQGLGATGLITKTATSEQLVYWVNQLLFSVKRDQRDAIRVPTTISANFTFGGKTSTGFIFNLSETGAFICYTTENPEAGDIISLRFLLPEKEKIIKADAKVEWVDEKKCKDGILVESFGTHFIKIDTEDRSLIATFVKEEFEKLEEAITILEKLEIKY